MTKARAVDYLGHMLDAIQLACLYVEGLDQEGFLSDRRTQQAVMLNIVVLGEAATKLANDDPEFVKTATCWSN